MAGRSCGMPSPGYLDESTASKDCRSEATGHGYALGASDLSTWFVDRQLGRRT